MKYLAIFLLIPFLSYGQIDATSDFVATSDSMIQAKPDTSFYQFLTGTQTFTRPNGTKKETPVFLATLIHRIGSAYPVGVH